MDPESAAFMAHLECGDVLVSVNSRAVASFSDLAQALDAASDSDAVTARVQRFAGGEEDIVVGALAGRAALAGAAGSINSSNTRPGALAGGSIQNSVCAKPDGAAGGGQFEWFGALGAQQRDLHEFWKELKMALP